MTFEDDKDKRKEARSYCLELLENFSTFKKRDRGHLREFVRYIAEKEETWSEKRVAEEVGYTLRMLTIKEVILIFTLAEHESKSL